MNDSYKYASEVISDFMTEAGKRNTCGTVLVPMATGSGKTYAAAEAAARLIADGDPHNSDRPSQIIYLTTRKAARNDYMDNLLAALSSRGYGREFTSRYVHLVEADADFVLSRIFTLSDAANGQVKISFNSDYLVPIKGFLENNWDTIDQRLVPSPRASEFIRSSVGDFEGRMRGLVANLNYLYSVNPVLRDAGIRARDEAVAAYKRFGRSVKMAYDLTIQFHMQNSELPAIKGVNDARELLKSLLYDPASPWTWIPSLFPQVKYIDARVLVMTATKARHPIDTVLFGSINVLKDDEPRYIFIDEADAVKTELLDSCINDAVDNHQNIPRELMLLNERLDNRIDSANKDLFKTFKDNGVVDNGFLAKWQEFSNSLRGLVAGESLVYSLKRKETLDREQSLFFASDVYGALSGASSTEHVITDDKNRVCWIVRPERDQVDGKKTVEKGERRTNLWVLSQKCTRTYHRLAKLTYYNAREYQAYRKRKDFSRDLIRANELFTSSEPTMASILSLVAELGLFDSESGLEEFAKYVYNLISTSTQSLNDEPFGIMSEEDCSIFHRGVDLMQLVDSEYHSTYTKVNTNSLKVTPEMIIAHLCNRSLVYLMSATIGIDHIGNFNLPYLDAASESGLIVPEGDYARELDRIAGLRDLAEVAGAAGLLAEERERGLLAVRRRVEGTGLDVLGKRLVIVGLVLHVVGERHDLEHVEVLAPLGLLEPLVEHALELRLDAALVVGRLHLEEGERDAVDKNVHVRPERPLALLAEEQLGDDGEVVGVDVGEVDEPGLVLRVDQPAVERLSHVVVADDGIDLGDELYGLAAGVFTAVQFADGGLKSADLNLGLRFEIGVA